MVYKKYHFLYFYMFYNKVVHLQQCNTRSNELVPIAYRLINATKNHIKWAHFILSIKQDLKFWIQLCIHEREWRWICVLDREKKHENGFGRRGSLSLHNDKNNILESDYKMNFWVLNTDKMMVFCGLSLVLLCLNCMYVLNSIQFNG